VSQEGPKRASPAAQRGPCAVLLTAPIEGFGQASVPEWLSNG